METTHVAWHRYGHVVASLIVVAGLGLSGCGAIGLYSLGHSILAHNHVLKPVLPDDPAACSEEDTEPLGESTGSSCETTSSCDATMPMEITRSPASEEPSTQRENSRDE